MTEEEINLMMLQFYIGELSFFTLPLAVYEYNFNQLIKEVESGFNGGIFDIPVNIPKWKTARDFRINIDFFSGSKTWQQTNDLTRLVFNPDGTKKPFALFEKEALAINDQYNKQWLKVEQDAAFRSAQNAEQWQTFEEEQELFPNLQYVTVGDGLVRPLHAAWDGIIKPVNDPFWNTRMPINEFGCRCRVIQIRRGISTNLDDHLARYNAKADSKSQVTSLKNDSKAFSNNPAKTGNIFDKKHPYFDIPDRFKKAQSLNFGFEPPKKPVRTKI